MIQTICDNIDSTIYVSVPQVVQEKKIYEQTEWSLHTLEYLIAEHVHLIIFRKISGLCALNRSCSLNYFKKNYQFPSILTLIDIFFY